MKLKTVLYGELEYEVEDIINFKDGLLGFNELRKCLLLSSWDNELPFFTLQSIRDNQLFFTMIKAEDFFADYKLGLSMADKKDLKYVDEDLIQVFNIVSFHDELEKTTVNLKGPVVINLSRHAGKQVVLDNDDYSVRYPLFSKQKEPV